MFIYVVSLSHLNSSHNLSSPQSPPLVYLSPSTQLPGHSPSNIYMALLKYLYFPISFSPLNLPNFGPLCPPFIVHIFYSQGSSKIYKPLALSILTPLYIFLLETPQLPPISFLYVLSTPSSYISLSPLLSSSNIPSITGNSLFLYPSSSLHPCLPCMSLL